MDERFVPARRLLAAALLQAGRLDEATTELEIARARARSIRCRSRGSRTASPHWATGRAPAACSSSWSISPRQRYVSAYHRALAHTAIGDRDGALGLLTQAFEQRDPSIINLGVEPRFDALGSDPRYQALVEQLGAPRLIETSMTNKNRAWRQADLLDHAQLRQLGLAGGLPRTRPGLPSRRPRPRARHHEGHARRPDCGCRPNAQLALSLGISRTTVVSAYRELEARGLVRGYVGRGTFVSAAPDSSGAPFAWRGKVAAAALRSTDSMIRDLVPRLGRSRRDLARGRHSGARSLPRRCVPAVARQGAQARGHGDVGTRRRRKDSRCCARRSRAGSAGSRKTCWCWPARSRGSICSCAASIDPGDTVVVDRPGYLGAIQTFRAAGARLVGWDVVNHDLDELEDHLVRYRPKLIYTNPTFQNPTGWTMPIRLRRDFLALASRLRVPIIEDDTYRELHFAHAAAALAAFARHAVGGDLLEQLFEGAGAGPAARMAVGREADRRAAGAHQAAGRSAHAESRAVRRRGSASRTARSTSTSCSSAPSTAAGATRWRPRCSATARRACCAGRCRKAGCIFWCRLGGRLQTVARPRPRARRVGVVRPRRSVLRGPCGRTRIAALLLDRAARARRRGRPPPRPRAGRGAPRNGAAASAGRGRLSNPAKAGSRRTP